MTPALDQFLNQTEQLQPLLKRLPVIINIVLIIACAQLLSEVIWMSLDQSSSKSITTASPANSTSSRNRHSKIKSQQHDFRKLSSAHLFGIAGKTSTQPDTQKAPETKLNLVLRGVLAAGTTQMASAIIAQGAKGKEEIYSIGDKIQGNITLREIHPEYVIIERQGQLETLRMEKSKGDDLISISNTIQPSTAQMSGASSQQLKNIRNNLIQNPGSFRKYALPVVVRENGKQVGYRLQPQQNSELLQQAGIEPTDIITSINGVRLDNVQNSIGALNALRSAEQVSVTVKRNGVEVPLNIQLQ